MGSIKRPPIYRIPLVQIFVILPIFIVVWWFNPTIAYSILLGGLIHLLPNTYFIFYAFRYQGARYAPLALRAMSRGETGKFVLTLVGFALAFKWYKDLNILALFVAYVAMIFVSVVIANHVIASQKSHTN